MTYISRLAWRPSGALLQFLFYIWSIRLEAQLLMVGTSSFLFGMVSLQIQFCVIRKIPRGGEGGHGPFRKQSSHLLAQQKLSEQEVAMHLLIVKTLQAQRTDMSPTCKDSWEGPCHHRQEAVWFT